MRGPQDACEHLLGLRPSVRSVATTADLARDDRGPEGLLGAPVRGIEIGIDQEAEERREFDEEMPRKALDLVDRPRIRKHVEHLIEQMAARHVDAVRRDRAGGPTIAHLKRVLQNRGDPCGKPGAGVIVLQRATAAEEMGETRLMEGVGKLAIGCPAVAAEAARKVLPEHRRRVAKAAARTDPIQRGRRRRKDPQPVQHGVHLPARFVGNDDGAGADGVTQGRVGRFALRRGAMEGADQRAGGHVQPEARAKQGGHLAERQAELFVQQHGQRDGLRAELHCGRAERIRGLQRISPLDAAVAAATRADMDVKPAHDRRDRRQILLILNGHVRFANPIATVRTALRQRHVVPFRHAGWHRPLPATSIRRTRLPSRTARPTRRRALRERRRLTGARAPRRLQFLFQSHVFALQPRPLPFDVSPLSFRPFELLPQARILSSKIIDGIAGLLIVGAPAHAPVMPEFSSQYKSDAVTKYDSS